MMVRTISVTDKKGDKQMSLKIKDEHGRWRNKMVSFRLSPEEDEQLERLVSLSGLKKQEYIVNRLLCRDVVVQGNPKVYKALRDQLAEVLDELRRIDARSGVDAGRSTASASNVKAESGVDAGNSMDAESGGDAVSSTDSEGNMDAGSRMNDCGGVSDELLDVIRMIAVILDGMRCENSSESGKGGKCL